MKTAYWILPACLLVLAGCAKKEEISSAKVEKRDVVGYELLKGELVVPPSAQANIGTPYLAPADKVMASVGDHVNRGEVLVQLSMPNAEANMEQARDYTHKAQTIYDQSKESLGVAVRQAKRDLDAARAAEKAARDNMDANLQNFTNARIAAEENLRAAQAELNANLEPYKQQLKDASEYVSDAQSGLKQGSIRTPITGTVITLNAKPGMMIGEDGDKPVATVVNLAALQVHGAMTPEQAGKFERGTRVTLSFAEIPDKEFEGKVSRVTSVPVEGEDNQHVYTAIIEFANTDAAVRPGMKLRFAGVKTGEAKDVIAVPAGALDKDQSGKPIVRVLEGDKWMSRVVEVGLTGIDYVEIKSGLKAGETVQVKS